MSVLVVSEILGLFVNTFTASDKCSLCNKSFFLNQFQNNYIRNNKRFGTFLVHFWNVYQISNILKEKMTFIGYVCSNLETAKERVS